MLGVFRQFGVSQALRASAPRTLSARSAQLCKWQAPATRTPVLARSFQTSFPAFNAATQATKEIEPESELITKFADLQKHELIDATLIRNIVSPVRMGLETMTEVQSQTINQMLQGDDVLAQAKTGTGKTLAFLLPTMQNILNDPTLDLNPRQRVRGAASDDIRALIISPTRELAEQIAAEARKLTPGTGLMVQTAVGGSHKRRGLAQIQHQGCHLLVGTPGRIKDIFSDRQNGVSAPKLNTLILDEADRLLDQGFSEEIEEIQRLLPDPSQVNRQTLMLSATVPKGVMRMVDRTLKPDYTYVQTVRHDEAPVHLRVPQKTVFVRGFENRYPAILELVKEYQARRQLDSNLRPFKAIVYFNATNEVQLAHEVFKNLPREKSGGSPLGRMPVLEIHSRLTQAQRTYSADSFRRASEGMLFSSDVTARGMDFPEVTHVIHVGIPNDRETYIHRTGRTARANKTGEAWMFAHDGEVKHMEEMLHGMPLQEDTHTLKTAMVDMTKDLEGVPESIRTNIEQIQHSMASLPAHRKMDTWRSVLGGNIRGFTSKRTAMQTMNQLASHGYGLTEMPAITHQLAKSLGVSRLGDLVNISNDIPRSPRDGGRDGGRGSRDGMRGSRDGGFGGFGNRRERSDRFDRSDRPNRSHRSDRSDRSDRPRRSQWDSLANEDGSSVFGRRSRY